MTWTDDRITKAKEAEERAEKKQERTQRTLPDGFVQKRPEQLLEEWDALIAEVAESNKRFQDLAPDKGRFD